MHGTRTLCIIIDVWRATLERALLLSALYERHDTFIIMDSTYSHHDGLKPSSLDFLMVIAIHTYISDYGNDLSR